MIITMDHEGKIVEFNPAAEQTFGRPRTEMVGRELAELIIPSALRQSHRRGLAHFLATGEGPILGRRIELQALHGEGSEFPVELAITPTALEGGPVMFTAHLRDIGGRKRDVAAAEERARLALLGVDVGIALVECDNLSDMLRRCCEAMVHHLEGAFARIWTLGEPGDVLVLQASAGVYTHLDGPHARVPVGKYKIGLIAEERKPHLTNDALDDPRVGDKEWARREGMVAFAGYPLIVGDRLIGVMAMFARHPLTQAALQAMGTVASGIALGIERKRAESELRDTEERVRLLLDSTGEGIYGIDLEGRCTFCNAAALRMLGYDDVAELLGQNVHALIQYTRGDGSPYPESESRIYQALRNGSGIQVDDEIFWRRDRTSFAVEYQLRPIVRDGERIGAVITFKNITLRMRAEQTMRLRDRSLAAIAQGLFITDPSRSDEPIIYVNKAFESMTGYTQREVAGRDVGFLRGKNTDPAAIGEIRAALLEGRACSVELRLDRKDGRPFWCALTASPVEDLAGRVTHFVGVMTDVTEQKAAQDALVEAKKAAEAASQAKSTFLANMSHELRTPMNAIIGYSEILEEEAPAALRPDIQKVHSAGEHLLGLISNILDLSKIEAGKMELYLETFDVAEMLRSVVDTVQPMVEKNGNTLEVCCSEDLGTMHADLTKVRQALLNLLSNAGKFTENGTIVLEAAREEVDAKVWVVLSVRDNGIGMTPEQVAKLFQPFTQADTSTTRKYGGTGLGLTISRHFTQMMGGDVVVQSELGRGTTFTIRLPEQFSAPHPVADTAEQAWPETGTGPRGQVLVIDDDPTVRDMLRRTLAKEGFRIQYAAGGKEGLELARRLKPDAITLDVMMPGMDGWNVLAALKSDPELAEIPVVMVTIVDNKNLGFSLGASDYLTKPIDRKRLAAILKRFRPGGTALVVDDDESSRQMVRQTLENEGWTVVEGENGRVGLERVGEAHPDLIILDLMMPEVDGFGFAEELSRHEAWRTIPILVVTAKDLSSEDRLRLHGIVFKILQKGIDTQDELINVIRREVDDQLRRQAKGLPADEDVVRPASAEFAGTGLAVPKILLVEDNETNREMLARRLERKGYEVSLAVDGREGVVMALAKAFDLILMDMSLPVLDGWEATRQLKADPRTRAVPIIALTAHAMSGDREKAIEAGCDDYDSKPIMFPRLVEKIETRLHQKANA
jgi:PAS domain S-box-containing protein